MTSTELVPLQRVWFRGGAMFDHSACVIVPPLPKNTMDVRWRTCIDHHTACDCREAELAEEANEYRLMYRGVEAAAKEVLAGHRTWPESYAYKLIWERREDGEEYRVFGYEFDEGACCQCTGCQIARKAHLR